VSVPGTVIVLNGTPRSGKSSIARAIQETFQGTWINLGVDVSRTMTPPRAQPGIGLRPGEPSHPAAAFVPILYGALWESIAAHARLGLNVVADVGLYDPAIADDATRRLAGLQVLTVGVRCPVDTVLERRSASPGTRPSRTATRSSRAFRGTAPRSVIAANLRWTEAHAAELGTFLA
jgi:chloramphenicol 3-O phosphotransferase